MDNLTPTPSVAKTMDFPDAIRKIMEGKKVTRISWANSDYCLLKDSFLMIYINGDFKKWLVNDGDMESNDWIVLEQN